MMALHTGCKTRSQSLEPEKEKIYGPGRVVMGGGEHILPVSGL